MRESCFATGSATIGEMSATTASHDSTNNGIASASRSDFVRFCIEDEKFCGNITLRSSAKSVIEKKFARSRVF